MRSTWLPEDALHLFARAPAPWWIAGGYALDLALGRTTRAHADLDVAILRRDQHAFRTLLAGWDVHVGAGEGVLAGPWTGDAPVDKPALWCRERSDLPWAFELLLARAEGAEWVFRHDPRTRLPLARIGARTMQGIPYLVPELVLLHKARRLEARDEADFEQALPRLGEDARAWLAEAIRRIEPAHAWLPRLR